MEDVVERLATCQLLQRRDQIWSLFVAVASSGAGRGRTCFRLILRPGSVSWWSSLSFAQQLVGGCPGRHWILSWISSRGSFHIIKVFSKQFSRQLICSPYLSRHINPHLIASQEVLELLQASLVLVVVVVEQVLATLDASWAGERGIREAVPRLKEDLERQLRNVSPDLQRRKQISWRERNCGGFRTTRVRT